jgi:riboflavin synthase
MPAVFQRRFPVVLEAPGWFVQVGVGQLIHAKDRALGVWFLVKTSYHTIGYRNSMFTGLVQSLAEVVEVAFRPPGCLLVLCAESIAATARIGDSVAINGCCLTCVTVAGGLLSFEAGAETLSRTNLGELAPGGQVNVEASLALGDRLGGHFVSGHVDAVGTLDARQDDTGWSTLWFRFPPALRRQMASKGSIAVDGVSLTLVDVEPTRFSVALIPHTLAHTTLGHLTLGSRVNLETDLLAKYVEQQTDAWKSNG